MDSTPQDGSLGAGVLDEGHSHRGARPLLRRETRDQRADQGSRVGVRGMAQRARRRLRQAMTVKSGELVLVRFPFSDLSSSKQRPALVLASIRLRPMLATAVVAM